MATNNGTRKPSLQSRTSARRFPLIPTTAPWSAAGYRPPDTGMMPWAATEMPSRSWCGEKSELSLHPMEASWSTIENCWKTLSGGPRTAGKGRSNRNTTTGGTPPPRGRINAHRVSREAISRWATRTHRRRNGPSDLYGPFAPYPPRRPYGGPISSAPVDVSRNYFDPSKQTTVNDLARSPTGKSWSPEVTPEPDIKGDAAGGLLSLYHSFFFVTTSKYRQACTRTQPRGRAARRRPATRAPTLQ